MNIAPATCGFVFVTLPQAFLLPSAPTPPTADCAHPPPPPHFISRSTHHISYTPLDTVCYVNEQWAPCSSRWTNVKESLDIFILGHFFGWWCKAILFRHAGISWAVSVGFELVELSFQHWLPNFYECWWDHIILDVLVCNAVGIVLGTLTCRYFSMKSCVCIPPAIPPLFTNANSFACTAVTTGPPCRAVKA